MITFLFIPGAETSLEEAASAVALQQRSEQPTAQPLQVGDGKSNFFSLVLRKKVNSIM